MVLKQNRHAVFSLQFHLVLVTKYRHQCITKDILKRLTEIGVSILEQWKCKPVEINGETDHIHLLFEAPPQVQFSKLINNLKTVSSRLIRKEFSKELKPYYWKPVFWSKSYCLVSAGGAPLKLIKEYIENQQHPT